MCGLCGFLYKDADRVGPVGRTLHAMLGPMARRGTDSTGIALYGPPQPGSYVVRARIDANHGTPERVAAALDAAGTVTERSQQGPNMRARITYAGDLGDLTDSIEAEPAVEVFSIGRAMEIVKEVGDADAVEAADPYSAFEGSHAIGHTRMATESLVDVAHSHPFWARPIPDDSEVIAVYIADKLERGESLEDALRASVSDLDGTFAYLISTPDGIGVARDPFALKPLLYAESADVALIASEEVAIRAVDADTALVPRELAAGEVRWWLR